MDSKLALVVAAVWALAAVLVTADAGYKNVHGGAVNREGIQPADLVNIGGDDYYISSVAIGPKNVLNARGVCNEIGMRLLSLQTQEKHDLITAFLVERGNDTTTFWTSGKRSNRQWLWSGVGEMFTYGQWSAGEPNYSANIDTCLYLQPNSGWFDANCSSFRYFICEQSNDC